MKKPGEDNYLYVIVGGVIFASFGYSIIKNDGSYVVGSLLVFTGAFLAGKYLERRNGARPKTKL